MSYATQQGMIDRFSEKELIQLTDRNDVGAIDTAVLSQALADADATINSYLESRYTLPLSSVPDSLVRICCDIARYFLYDKAATEQVSKRYDDAVGFLQKVATGSITLGPVGTGEEPAEADGAQMESDTPVFRRDKSTGFI